MSDTVAPRPDDIRPMVRRAPNNRAVWIFGGVLTLLTIGLFSTLEARRSVISSPSISAAGAPSGATITAPPELNVPPDYDASYYPRVVQPVEPGPALRPPVSVLAPVPASRSPRRSDYSAVPSYTGPMSPISPYAQDPGRTFADADALPRRPADEEQDSDSKNDRVNARRLRNPSTTVPQGAVMQAVLETALDSSRAGFARAIISRDVSSFDGTRVLVPKGSKLFGEYQADVGQGQSRALIRWRRLTRPDGVIIDVDSPSADPLGRAGVKGKVNSHFFERFSGAILQSALDFGVQLAGRRASRDTYVVAIPNGLQGVNPVKPEEIKPTVTVRQGTSVSVFIARDLDFTEVGG